MRWELRDTRRWYSGHHSRRAFFVPNVLFIHKAFPAQYQHIATALGRDPAWQVTFLTESRHPLQIPGVNKALIKAPLRPRHQPEVHAYVKNYDLLIRSAEIYFNACRELVDKRGLRPDVVAVHLGSGIEQFVRDAFPDIPIVTYHEYFPPPDRDFQQDFPPRPRTANDRKAYRIFVSHILSQLVWSDWSITPTFWQRSLFPKIFHPRLSVLHDGIDTQAVDPDKVPALPLPLPDGTFVKPDEPIVTYVARNLDNVRGFPTIMRAIKVIQQRRPDCHFVVVGKDAVGYGRPVPDGGTWREALLAELDLDLTRVHFLGQINYAAYVRLLRVSSAHMYFTTAFALSWSLLEAMAMGCVVVASATPPVEEVIVHGHNALLAGFHDHEQLADHVLQALAEPGAMQSLRREARQTILQRYALKDLLPLHQDLLMDLASGRIPPPTATRIDERNRQLGLGGHEL